MAKKLIWIEAAEIAGMSARNMQRKRQAYQEFGYTGLFDQRRGKRSIHPGAHYAISGAGEGVTGTRTPYKFDAFRCATDSCTAEP